MSDHEKNRILSGRDEPASPPAGSGLSESDAVRKDETYSPASETETQAKQADPLPDSLDEDIDPDQVLVTPGTGGPDDVGDVEVDPDDLNLPGRS
ncbi:hypothetical protein [Microbacterium sp. BK668]|uniref:hypothetical protein n=1 Tax=Microbacterium sp. BK668 TaxID=2512118 RepID=UPI0010D8CB05|nr:hypothetical protein [Microbacterium sp. BK668]TDN92580.1 hypothetical protein EV279_2104 [Microbacterium sp. BK668]